MLAAILDRLRAQPSRTGSLIVTLFGDAVAPRGGTLALASLTGIFRVLGIGDGVVGTAVSRLTAEGWLERSRTGRHSFYRLSPRAAAETERAVPRIYGPALAWDGRLRLLIEPGADRGALVAAGWGAVNAGLLISPFGPEGTLFATGGTETLRALAARAWPLADLARRYHAFLATFPADAGAGADEALPVRLLMVHEFRRLALRDPGLPDALLPADWPGHAARARAAELYERLRGPSERWLDAHALGAHGRLPPATEPRRFAAAVSPGRGSPEPSPRSPLPARA
jgi:phenylacetic acid degradation operon negative regulatory protein